MPADGEQAVLGYRPAAGEIVQHPGSRPPAHSRGQPGVSRKLTRPERRGGGEAVDEAASLDQRRAVAPHKAGGVVEEVGQPLSVTHFTGLDPRIVRGHERPELRVDLEGPADVVVIGAFRAVGKPAVAAVQGIMDGQPGVDVPVRISSSDAGQERLHHDLEPHPVDGRVFLSDDRFEPGDQLCLDALREFVPQHVAGQRQPDRQRGRLHLGLSEFPGRGPAVLVGRVGPGVKATGIPVRNPACPLGVACHPEGRQKEGPCERLQRIASRAVGAVGTRQPEVGVVFAAVPVGGAQQEVGVGTPVLTGQAGVRRQLTVQCGQGQGSRRRCEWHGFLGVVEARR